MKTPHHIRRPRLQTNLFLVLSAMAGLHAAKEAPAGENLPLGHPDFRPSSQRPVGERGDWTGLFPGAKGVALEWDHRSGKNILWKSRLPGWSNSSPIVVGDKVFVGSEPDELVCVDARSGKLLWRKSIFTDVHIPETERAAVRQALREVEDQALAMDVPGLDTVAQWLAVLPPEGDPAAAATAKRLAGFVKRCQELGQDPAAVTDRRAFDVFPKASAEILVKHKMMAMDKNTKEARLNGTHVGYHAQFGWTMPTPTSDGTYVWCQTGLGAIACLDLDGKTIWNVRLPTEGATMKRFTGCGSPALIGDKLVYAISGKTVVGAEKATGKEFWRVVSKAGGRGSSGVVPLRFHGKDLIVSMGKEVLDAANGAEVASLPFGKCTMDARRGHTVFGHGDSILTAIEQYSGRVRLDWKDGQIAAELLWSGGGPAWHCVIADEKYVYYTNEKGTQINIYCQPLAGPALPKNAAIFKDNRPTWEIPPALRKADSKGKIQTAAQGWQYAAPAIAEGHLFAGHDTQGMSVFRLAGPDSKVVSRNFMDLFIRGNPFFQGNRMYVRSMHYLYCMMKIPSADSASETQPSNSGQERKDQP